MSDQAVEILITNAIRMVKPRFRTSGLRLRHAGWLPRCFALAFS